MLKLGQIKTTVYIKAEFKLKLKNHIKSFTEKIPGLSKFLYKNLKM